VSALAGTVRRLAKTASGFPAGKTVARPLGSSGRVNSQKLYGPGAKNAAAQKKCVTALAVTVRRSPKTAPRFFQSENYYPATWFKQPG
jgi:hypothetical protein